MYQQEKNHASQLSLLNATISHELRNPLNSIKARNMELKYILQIIKQYMQQEDIELLLLRTKMNSLLTKLENG
jgi:signal transduction histidine kinase